MDNKSINEFYLTASEFCKLVEYTSDTNKMEFISRAQKILSFVYLKASLIKFPYSEYEGETEKFVQEDDWIFVKNNVAKILGFSDRFIELVLPDQADPENYENIKLSECFADIYQDLKDFVTGYEIGNEDGVIASLTNCQFNFEKYWGQRLIGTLAYLHNYLYSSELYDDEEFSKDELDNDNNDTSDWLINRRFED